MNKCCAFELFEKNSNLFPPEHPSEVRSRLYINCGKNSFAQTLDKHVLGKFHSWLIQRYGYAVCGKLQEKCHRFWLRLHQAMILISKVRTSASKKINQMALIRTPTISTTTFERMKEKLDSFRQTVWMDLA